MPYNPRSRTCESCRICTRLYPASRGGKQAHDPLHCGELRAGHAVLSRPGPRHPWYCCRRSPVLPFRGFAVLPYCRIAGRGRNPRAGVEPTHGTPHRSGQHPWVARPCRDREHALRRTAALPFPRTYKYAILRHGRLPYCRSGRSVPGRVARPAWPAGPDAPHGRRRCARVTARTAGHLELGPNLDVEAVPVGLASTENPGRTGNPGTDRSIHGTRPVLLLGSRVEVVEGAAEVVGGEPPARLRVGSASWHSGPSKETG